MKTLTAVSAGGVIVDDEGRVVLTARRSFAGALQWGLPKGLVEPGESTEQGALREAREETGLEVVTVGPLPTIDYWYLDKGANKGEGARVHKIVHYFLMRPTGGSPDAHDGETEEVAFLPPAEALARATFKSERDVIKAALPGGGV